MATKPKVIAQPGRTITVTQAARYLAITNMAIEGLLVNSKRKNGRRFNLHTLGWQPEDGKEIDDAFTTLRYVSEDAVYEGLNSEFSFFLDALKSPNQYSETFRKLGFRVR